uniref:Uncharacterized protein n=1 Tax=Arundo donax TaxID=35708 RepID=A0A0A9GCR4_ARUDO
MHCATCSISCKVLSMERLITMTSKPRSPMPVWRSASDSIFPCLEDSIEEPKMS